MSEVQASSPTHSKIKEMRRIQQKTQAPADKAELVNYLNDRIKQAEDALNDTEQLLQCEVKEREKISKMIEERNIQLEKLYTVDQKGLPEKIKQKLTEMLTTTISQKVDAEEELSNQKSKNYEYKQMYQEIRWEEKNITHKLTQQKTKEDALQKEIGQIQSRNIVHEEELKGIEANFTEIKQKKEKVENKYLQMKVAIQRMNDVRAVLNRFFGNEDLFDQKMDLKEQKVHRVEVLSRENQQRTTMKETKNQTKLKPLNYTKNDDQDFWRGDFSKNKL